MGKRNSFHNCVFTVRLTGQPDQKFDYTGLLSWLVANPDQIANIAPDFAAQSTGMRNIINARAAGSEQTSAPPVAPPTAPVENVASEEVAETIESDISVSDEDMSVADMLDRAAAKRFGKRPENQASPTTGKKKTTRSQSTKTTPAKPKGEIKEKLSEATKNAGKTIDSIEKLIKLAAKTVTPGPNTNTMLGAAWDDSFYEEFKREASNALLHYKATVKNLSEAMDLILDQLLPRLSESEFQFFRPYLLKFFQELKDGKIESDLKGKQPSKAEPVQGVFEAGSVDELLKAKVSAYVEVGNQNGEHGVYLVYNDKGRGVPRVLLHATGRDANVALSMAGQIARQLHHGVDSVNTKGATYKQRLTGKTIGVSTSIRDTTAFGENAAIGNQALGWGEKHPNVKLKDLFDLDPDYAMEVAQSATQGIRAITVREYLRARPEYLQTIGDLQSALQSFKQQTSRIQKERALKRGLKALKITAHVAFDRLVLHGVTTDEQVERITEIGADWNDESGQIEVRAENLEAFLEGLSRESAKNEGRGSGEDETGGTGIRDPKILRLRRWHDAIPDESALGLRIDALVDQSTQDLLLRGRQFGIPEKIVNEQIEDVAKISKIWKRKQDVAKIPAFKPETPRREEPGLFILASDPGSGKTFVLGGAIRELRRQGAKRITYVTLNKALIAQVKKNLKDYGVDDVEFVTYSGLRNGALGGTLNTPNVRPTDVLIFDEAHTIKKIGDASVAMVAQRVIAKTQMAVFASATPYENPTQMEYLEPTGIFSTFGGYVNFARAYGAQASQKSLDNPDAKQKVWWVRDSVFSDDNAAAARAWINKLGLYTQREIQLPMELVDMRLKPVQADSEMRDVYYAIKEALSATFQSQPGLMDRAYLTNYLKRVLEASKVSQAVIEAQAAIEAGRFPIIFTETKVDRTIDVDYWNEQEIVYAQAVAAARATGDSAGPRSDYGLPPSRFITEVFTIATGELGYSTITIPAAEDVITESIDKSKIAVYNGSVSDPEAQRNLASWRLGTKPLLLATMDKGGTGLSLHDEKGDHPTTMIVLNLPWTATKVKQVAQRNARYGLKSRAEIIWLFANDIGLDRELGQRVGGRINDMSNTVTGENSSTGQRFQDWDLDAVNLEELVDVDGRRTGVLRTETGEEISLSDFEPTNMLAAMAEAMAQAADAGEELIAPDTVSVGTLRDILKAAHGLTTEGADEIILHFAGHYEPSRREKEESFILVPYGNSDTTLTDAQIQNSLVDSQGQRFGGVRLRTTASPDSASTEQPVDSDSLVRGDEADILLVDNGVYKAHYEIRELDDLIPSHKSATFHRDPRYTLVNDRDYENNKANQTSVISQAQNYQPQRTVNTAATSVEGSPMILPSGIVLGGNGRTIVLGRVYQDNPKATSEYIKLLSDRAGQFGFTADQVGEFDKPVLVRVIDSLGDDSPQAAITRLNADPQKALSDTEQSIARGRSITPEVINLLGTRIGESGTLAAALADSGVEIINTMVSSGMVAENDRPRWIDTKTGKVTEFTKDQIKNMLVGSLFNSTTLMEQTPDSIMQRLERIAPSMLRIQSTAWDIRSHFPNAIEAIIEARATNTTYKDLARTQVTDFSTGKLASKYNLVEISIAAALGEPRGAKDAAKPFQDYVEQALYDITGQGGLFMQIMPKLQAFETFFPTPTGERIPQFVLDAQARLDDHFKQGIRQANMLGLDSIARLGDLAIVAGWKLIKAGQSLKAWQQSVVEFLGAQKSKAFNSNARLVDSNGQLTARGRQIVEATDREYLTVNSKSPMASVVSDVAGQLQKTLRTDSQKLGLGSMVNQVAEAGVRLYQKGLSRADWLSKMIKQFGRDAQSLLKKAWEAIRLALRKFFSKTDPTVQALEASLKRATTESRRQALLAAIQAHIQNVAMDERLSQAQDFSVQSLQEIEGIDADMAETIINLYQSMGIDLARVKIAKGGKSQNKALVEFAPDGRALIRAYEGADVSSFAHEAAHIYRRWLLNTANGHTRLEIKAFERWAGVKDGNWTEQADEKVAKAFERYLRNGIAPSERYAPLFAKMKNWLRQIYRVLSRSPISARVPKIAWVIFDDMFADDRGGIKTVIPTVGESRLNQFIGAKGNATGSAMAQRMENAAIRFDTPMAEKEQIWKRIGKETGWHRIIETEPFMYEVDTSKATLKNLEMAAGQLKTQGVYDTTLEKVINYPELFTAYPDFRKMAVSLRQDEFTSMAGAFSSTAAGANPSIRVSGPILDYTGKPDTDELMLVFLHEIQHAIQKKEGFSEGSNLWVAATVKGTPERGAEIERELRKKYPDWYVKRESVMGKIDDYEELADWMDLVSKLYQDAPQEIRLNRRYYELSTFDVYRAATGEAMARLVERRSKMTTEERQLLPPREHLKQMLESERLLSPYSPYPEDALLPNNGYSGPRTVQQSAQAPLPTGSDRLLRVLKSRLANTTDPVRQQELQGQIAKEYGRLRSAAPAPGTTQPTGTGKPKLNLSQYDNMTVSDLVNQLTNTKTTQGMVSIRDPKPITSVTTFEQNLIDLAGLPRAIMSSADISAPLRQGAILTLPPHQWGRAARAFEHMFSSLVSRDNFSDFRAWVTGHRLFTTAQASGLYIASQEIGENVITGGEETFVSRLAKQMPIFGPMVKASERSYIAYLDSLRMSTFARYVDVIERQGGTQQQRRAAVVAAAKWINIATGRGSFEGKLQPLERAMPLLGTVFFAPRYVQSRLQLLSPRTYFQQPPAIRRQAMLDIMGFAGAVAAISAMAMFAGADVEWDPEDEDFLKIRFGNLRYDFLAGTQQAVRLFFLVGKAWGTAFVDSVEEAVTGTPSKRKRSRTGAEIIGRFMRSKLAPIPSFFVDMQERKDFIGRPFEITQGLIDRTVPMFWRESTEAYLRGGWSGAAQQIPSVLGVGVSDYEKVSGIFDLGKTPYTTELTRKGIELGRLKPKEAEAIPAFKARALKTQGLLSEYGTQLVTSSEYQALSENGKETALRILRDRVARDAPDQMYNAQMITLAAVLAEIQQKTQEAKEALK